MIETITKLNAALSGFIWGVPAMIALMGVGIYLSIRTEFLQIRKFGYIMKTWLIVCGNLYILPFS